jgi:hypothetical protein
MHIGMIALTTVIVLPTLALIFSITAVTPQAAKLNTRLPPNVTLVNMYRRRVLHFLKVSLVFLATAAAACIIPGAVRYIAATLLAMGLLLIGTIRRRNGKRGKPRPWRVSKRSRRLSR